MIEPSKVTCYHCHKRLIRVQELICAVENCIIGRFRIIFLLIIYYNKMRENEMRKAYSMHARNGKCVRSLIRRPRITDVIWKTYESLGREGKY
jgi:hypothetical protein